MFKLFGNGAPPRVETAGYINPAAEMEAARAALTLPSQVMSETVTLDLASTDPAPAVEATASAEVDKRTEGERIADRIYQGPFTIAVQVNRGEPLGTGTASAGPIFGDISSGRRRDPNTPFALLTNRGGRQVIGFNLMPEVLDGRITGYTTMGEYFGDNTRPDANEPAVGMDVMAYKNSGTNIRARAIVPLSVAAEASAYIGNEQTPPEDRHPEFGSQLIARFVEREVAEVGADSATAQGLRDVGRDINRALNSVNQDVVFKVGNHPIFAGAYGEQLPLPPR